MENKEVPRGVKITSFLYCLIAILVVVQIVTDLLSPSRFDLLLVLGRLGIVVLTVFIGMGLWNEKRWAKIVTLIFSGLVFTYLFIISLWALILFFVELFKFLQVYSLSDLPSGILGNIPYISILEYLIVFVGTGFVFFYFLRNKEAKEFFK